MANGDHLSLEQLNRELFEATNDIEPPPPPPPPPPDEEDVMAATTGSAVGGAAVGGILSGGGASLLTAAQAAGSGEAWNPLSGILLGLILGAIFGFLRSIVHNIVIRNSKGAKQFRKNYPGARNLPYSQFGHYFMVLKMKRIIDLIKQSQGGKERGN